MDRSENICRKNLLLLKIAIFTDSLGYRPLQQYNLLSTVQTFLQYRPKTPQYRPLSPSTDLSPLPSVQNSPPSKTFPHHQCRPQIPKYRPRTPQYRPLPSALSTDLFPQSNLSFPLQTSHPVQTTDPPVQTIDSSNTDLSPQYDLILHFYFNVFIINLPSVTQSPVFANGISTLFHFFCELVLSSFHFLNKTCLLSGSGCLSRFKINYRL